MAAHKPIFITATDTHVGKTIAVLVLATVLKARGHKVGIFKPVQCAGCDAAFLKEKLAVTDDLKTINPYYASEAISPHLAFRRAGKKIDIAKIQKALQALQAKYDVMLIEGAGGLMVPLKNHYYNADLIKDLGAEAVLVSRLGLGTINHTLLTIRQIQAQGIAIKGILFSDPVGKKGVPEKTNPIEIQRLSRVPMLGIIPQLKNFTAKEILSKCQKLATSGILSPK